MKNFLKVVAALAILATAFSCTKKTELSLSTKSLTFDADITVAQPQTVTVTTNTAWRAMASENWLSISPVSGPESGSFTVSVVNFNKELTDRKAQITVVADDLTEVITVTQKALVPVLSVAANGWDINAPIPAKGTGARQLVVTSNVPWTLTVTGGGDWFTYAPDSGNENGYVSMGWHANYELEERSVKLDFSAAGGQTASVTFKQLAAEPSRQIDSLALVAIYNAFGGAANMKEGRVWDLSKPLDDKNSWYGVTLNEAGRVSALKLLKGTITADWSIPAEIGKLTELTDLRFIDDKVTGSMPESLYNLTKLVSLYLTNNTVTWSLSSKVASFPNLKDLYIDQNANLSGELPKELGTLTKLVNINVSQTSVSGAIPAEMVGCTSLNNLMAFKTKITGIPDNFDKWPALKLIQLYGNPGLTGALPASVGNATKLTSVWFYECNFEGNIPESWANLPATCKQLRIQDNKLSGVVPAAIQAHANWTTWDAAKYILPQQDGYGLTLPEPASLEGTWQAPRSAEQPNDIALVLNFSGNNLTLYIIAWGMRLEGTYTYANETVTYTITKGSKALADVSYDAEGKINGYSWSAGGLDPNTLQLTEEYAWYDATDADNPFNEDYLELKTSLASFDLKVTGTNQATSEQIVIPNVVLTKVK